MPCHDPTTRPEAAKAPIAPPCSDVESMLASEWRHLLGTAAVGRSDDFFVLGGNSLQAMRLVARIDRRLGLRLAVRTVFDRPVLADLAREIEAGLSADRPPPAEEPPDAGSGSAGIPALPAQRGMWMLQEALPDPATYNQPFAFRPDAAVDWERFRGALDGIMARHPALRCRIIPSPSGPLQQVEAPGAVELAWSVEPAVGPAELTTALLEYARRPFDLTSTPLWRATLFPAAAPHGVVLLVFHHAIIDQWSIGLLLEDLERAGNGMPALPRLPPFRLAPPEEARAAELERVWQAALADAPEAVRLPGAAPTSGAGTAGQTLRHRIGGIAGPLGDVARAARATAAQVLLAAFQAWLHRITRAPDTIVVTPISLRGSAVADTAFGCLLNTVPIRIRFGDGAAGDATVPPRPTFLDCIGVVGRALRAAADHADLPIDRIVAAARPGRPGATLADILVVVTEGASAAGRFGAARLEALPCDTATAKFGATVFLDVDGDDVEVAIEYATAVYDAPLVAAHLGTLSAFLAAALRAPGVSVDELPLAATADAPAALPEDTPWSPVHAAIERQARLHPDVPAVIAGPHALGFAEFDAASRALAAGLASRGVGPGDRVGLCLPRGAASCVGLVGILRCGAACVPLDRSLPAARLGRMVDIAGVRVVVGDDATPGLVASFNPPGGHLAVVPVSGHPPAATFADRPVDAASLLYVLFTSGSTGEPKGVEMPHGPLASLVAWQCRSTPRVPGERTLHFASMGFDVAFQELFSTWAAGCTVVVADGEARLDPARLVDLATDTGVDRIFLPTAMLAPFAEAALAAGTPPPTLRDLIVAGERLRITPPVRGLFARLPGCHLWNHYGPTESHVVTACRLDGPPESWPDSPPIGSPVDGARISILDPGLRPLPAGCIGEIGIGGRCLARGYAARPDLTAERFGVDRHGDPPARIYRTGDLGWRHPDGSFRCLGRVDRQVKLRGHRIEPEEVEAALVTCPGIREAVVLVRADDGDAASGRLVALVEVGPGYPGPDAIRARLMDTLTEPMVPTEIMALDVLPRNVNGKIDRRRLASAPLPACGAVAAATEADPPRGAVESTLGAEWCRILGLARVGRGDDFFASGGHSLPAMALVAAIDRRFGVRLPVRAVFERPRLADLAASVSARLAVDGGIADTRPPRRPAPEPEPAMVPALPAQRGMWLLQELLPDPAAYNQPVALRAGAALDWQAFRDRLGRAMDRHPALRASLAIEDELLVQHHAPVGSLPLPWQVEDEVGPEALDATLRDRARVPFDLAAAPLWRAILFPAASPHGVLLLLFHHAVVDDWSIRSLLGELAGGDADDVVVPPPPPAAAEGDREFWSRLLAGAPTAVAWPARPTPPSAPTGRGGVHRVTIPTEVVGAWQGIAQGCGATLFHAWLGACHVWLQAVAGGRDSVILTPVATRTEDGVQSAVGCHLNTLPTRYSSRAGRQTAATVAAAIRARFLDALDHGGLPFDEIVAAIPRSSGNGLQPLANAMFVFLDERTRGCTFAGVPLEPLAVHTGTARLDLTVTITRTGGDDAVAELEYALDVLDEATVRTMAGRLLALLGAVAAAPDVDLGSLDLLEDSERRLVLDHFAGDVVDLGAPVPLQALVSAAATRCPASVAIRDGARTITHAGLDTLARSWSRRLRACGVGPGTRVGVAVPRSADYVAVILGVLRSGAAWVPLDVGAATTRAEFIAADAGVVAVVSVGPPGIRLPAGVTVIDLAAPGLDETSDDETSHADDGDVAAPAYVIYTSGSTGKPKGVVVPHAAAVAFVRAMERRFPLSADDVVLFSTGTTFDISIYEVFGALAAGASIVVAPAGPAEPAALAAIVADTGVTVAQFVPSFLGEILERDAFAGSRRLRRVLCGGEALPATLASRFLERSAAELVNVYGPTEATVWATSWVCPRGTGPLHPLIGRPLDSVRARILDESLRPVPVGVAAELCLGGVQVAAGYLGREDLSGERFIDDPHGAPGDRLYRTGDLCRWTADGTIEFLGRLDHQVKIRGHRIELGEVEAEIERVDPGSRAVVLAREDRPGDVRLAAYVVGGTAPDETLRARLAATLPEASWPSSIVRLGAFPLTAHGKIDRAALPTPLASAAVPSAPPRGPTETAIAAIWVETLGVAAVGRDDRFFDIGGHSLLALRVIAAVERSLGVRLPLRGFFTAPRLADLAALVDHLRGAAVAGAGIGDAAEPRAGEGPASATTLLDAHQWLVPLRPHGDAAPLFLFPGIGGGISHFLPMVGRLSARTPVYGLLSRSLGVDVPADASLAGTVESYADEIGRFAPRGPVNLGSHSHGGWIAYEVARVLRARGRVVGTVILLDTHPLARLPLRARPAAGWWWCIDRIQRQVEFAAAVRNGHVPRTLRKVLGGFLAGLPEVLDGDGDDQWRLPFVALVTRHQTGAYAGRVDLVRASDARWTMVPHWRWLVGAGLRVHPVPILHHSMCEESEADIVGAVIRGILEEVDAGEAAEVAKAVDSSGRSAAV